MALSELDDIAFVSLKGLKLFPQRNSLGQTIALAGSGLRFNVEASSGALTALRGSGLVLNAERAGSPLQLTGVRGSGIFLKPVADSFGRMTSLTGDLNIRLPKLLGVDWTLYPGVLNAPVNRILWFKPNGSQGRFIATAAAVGQRIWTSFDGKAWTASATPSEHNYQQIAWRPDTQLLMSASGGAGTFKRFIRSADFGVTWTELDSSNNSQARGNILYVSELNVWISAGGSGFIETSNDDGATWTQRTSGTGALISELFWCPGIGNPGTVVAVLNNAINSILLSSDAINWSLVALPGTGSSFPFHGVWSKRLRKAFVGSGASTSTHLVSSSDLQNWEIVSTLNVFINGIVDTPQTIIYTASGPLQSPQLTAGTSVDGINTVARELPANGSWNDLAYSPDLDIVVGIGIQSATPPAGTTTQRIIVSER